MIGILFTPDNFSNEVNFFKSPQQFCILVNHIRQLKIASRMTEREKANRDLKREMISRTLVATDASGLANMSLPKLRAMLGKNEKTFDELCELQSSVVAMAKNATVRKSAMDWLPEVEIEYNEVRKRLSERIAQLEQACNSRNRPHGDARVPQLQAPEPHAGFPEGLIEFDGTHANWPSFRDLFVALVDS